MLSTQLVALTLTATALAASGCGGSSSKGGGSATTAATAPTTTATSEAVATLPSVTPVRLATGKPLSHAQFVARAEAICAHTNAKVAAMTVITSKEYARELPQAVAYYANETSELGTLVPPPSLAHVWTAFVNDFHLYTEYGSAMARYARANNFSPAAPFLRAANGIQERFEKLAAHHGFKHCGSRN